MSKWIWSEKGVKIGDQEFTFRAQPAGAAQQYAGEMTDARRIFSILKNALEAFNNGHASYVNAIENLRALCAQFDEAADRSADLGQKIANWYEPVGIFSAVGAEQIVGFILETLERYPQ